MWNSSPWRDDHHHQEKLSLTLATTYWPRQHEQQHITHLDRGSFGEAPVSLASQDKFQHGNEVRECFWEWSRLTHTGSEQMSSDLRPAQHKQRPWPRNSGYGCDWREMAFNTASDWRLSRPRQDWRHPSVCELWPAAFLLTHCRLSVKLGPKHVPRRLFCTINSQIRVDISLQIMLHVQFRHSSRTLHMQLQRS